MYIPVYLYTHSVGLVVISKPEVFSGKPSHWVFNWSKSFQQKAADIPSKKSLWCRALVHAGRHQEGFEAALEAFMVIALQETRCGMMRHDVWTFQSSLPAESCLGCSASNTSLWASWADVTWMHPLQISILSVFPWSSLWNLCVSYLCVLHHFHASCHIISDHFTFWAQG